MIRILFTTVFFDGVKPPTSWGDEEQRHFSTTENVFIRRFYGAALFRLSFRLCHGSGEAVSNSWFQSWIRFDKTWHSFSGDSGPLTESQSILKQTAQHQEPPAMTVLLEPELGPVRGEPGNFEAIFIDGSCQVSWIPSQAKGLWEGKLSDAKCLGMFQSEGIQTCSNRAIQKPAIQPNVCFKVVVHLLWVMQVDLSMPRRAPWAGAQNADRAPRTSGCWRLSTLCMDGFMFSKNVFVEDSRTTWPWRDRGQTT